MLQLNSETTPRRSGFVDRMHLMRTLGLALGFLPVASVLHENGANALAWTGLVVNGFAWPHLAWWWARHSTDARKAELRNLMIDSAMGGLWIAVMEFNLLPSALLVLMLSIDKIGVGGWRLLARTFAVQVVVCLATSAMLGFPVRWHSSTQNILASLPFLFGYPLAISTAAYGLVHTVAQQNRLLERLNRIDTLTGLPNRRHLEESAAYELARYLRTRRPSVMLLIDIDKFKEVNDHHGHQVGDEVLRKLAAVLRGCCREIDTPARYGGDEFAVLLAETDLAGARDVAERIRSTFLTMRGPKAEQERCALSLGLAETDRLLVSVDEWVRRADASMYQAKSSGGNQVGTPALSMSLA